MKNKVVVITGASSGIGKALAVRFLHEGSSVVIAARRIEALENVRSEPGMSALLPVACDVSIEADCRRLMEETVKKFGRIDVLVNNAGISMRALFENTDLDVIRRVMDINFWGTVYCTKYALPHLLESKGSVAGISSIAGKMGLPGRTGYSASKFAMEGFLETIRNENLARGLHVLVACPGFTESNIRNTALSADGTPQGQSPRNEKKMMSAEDVAASVYNAIRSGKRDLILTSSGKTAVFIKKFFPAWMDRILLREMQKEDGSPLR